VLRPYDSLDIDTIGEGLDFIYQMLEVCVVRVALPADNLTRFKASHFFTNIESRIGAKCGTNILPHFLTIIAQRCQV